LGIDAGPDGGARFIAGPVGGSGTEAGGTGGGRSLNNCAETGPESTEAINRARIGAKRQRPYGRPARLPCHPRFMTDAFH